MASRPCENCLAPVRNMATYCNRCGAPQAIESAEITFDRDTHEVSLFGLTVTREDVQRVAAASQEANSAVPTAPSIPAKRMEMKVGTGHLGLRLRHIPSGEQHYVTA